MNYVFGLESFALNDLVYPEYKKSVIIYLQSCHSKLNLLSSVEHKF